MRRLMALAVASLTAGSALAQPASMGRPAAAEATTLSCDGPVRQGMSEAELRAALGEANVQRADVYVGEGMSEPGLVLFPNEPTRMLEVLFSDGAARGSAIAVMARPGTTAWTGPGGVRVGSTLAEVERANGRPFALYGFEWDYGGRVSDWRGGAIHPADGRCQITMTFTAAEDANLDGASGDSEFQSDSAGMRAARPAVAELGVSFLEEEMDGEAEMEEAEGADAQANVAGAKTR